MGGQTGKGVMPTASSKYRQNTRYRKTTKNAPKYR
jgi:hypothetical protein